MSRTLRIAGIFVCGGLLLAPQVACFMDGASLGGLLKAMNFVRLLFPLTFYVLAHLLIDEGRARAREEQARKHE